MVILYTAPSCTSCRKAKAWLQTHDIDFQEHNLFTEPLSIEKIKQILQLTESGKNSYPRHRMDNHHSNQELLVSLLTIPSFLCPLLF